MGKKTDAFGNIFRTLPVLPRKISDRDGDVDLFIGARNVPLEVYGDTPHSYLLINDGRVGSVKQPQHWLPGWPT